MLFITMLKLITVYRYKQGGKNYPKNCTLIAQTQQQTVKKKKKTEITFRHILMRHSDVQFSWAGAMALPPH